MKSIAFVLSTALFALGLLLAPNASAQNGAFAPYAVAGGSLAGTDSVLSSTHPNAFVSAGIESSTKHLLLDGNFQFLSANGISTASGYTETVTGSGYYKLGGFLVGGGASYSNQIASGITFQVAESTYLKGINVAQIRPFVGGGYQFSRDRIIVNYVLPGSGPAQVASGPSFQIRNEVFLGKNGLLKHVRAVQSFDFVHNSTGTTWVGGGGLKLIL